MRRLDWSRWRGLLGIIGLALASNVIVLWSASRLLAFVAGFTLTCLLPGYLLARVVLAKSDGVNWVETIALTAGMGYAALILGALGLHYLPGPLSPGLILPFYDGLVIALALVHFLRRKAWGFAVGHLLTHQCLLLLGLLLVAGLFRLGNLGYSEFQGDESRAVLMAAGVVRGEDDILFLHKKGPAEILLPATFYALYGTINELIARLPFALANLAGLTSVYALVRRMFPRRALAAPVAVGLLAVDGYLVAFGRLVQYQSVVLLMVGLAAWCSYVWYRDGKPVLLALAALFVAVGTLAHYEAILVAPFVAWLFWLRGRSEGWPPRRWIQYALGPTAAFTVIFCAFYVPFVRHPHFAATAEYITERRVGGGLLYNNLGDFFFRATFYNSTYYILFLIAGLLALATHLLWQSLRPVALAVAAWVALAVGLAVVALFPQALAVHGLNLALLPFAAVLAVLIASPRIAVELRATFLWFGTPFLIALFLMQKPKTHVYLLFSAWAVLIGVTISQIVAGLDQRIGKSLPKKRFWATGLAAAGVALLAVFGYYTYIVFVRHTPDFRRGYPATRPPFYATFYGDQSPKGGGFGFPHRGGWKAVGALYAQGVLQGSYSANEETLTTSWYTRQAAWCRDAADYYFITSVVHDSENIPEDLIRQRNHLLGRVWSEGRTVLEIYSRRPVDVPTDYDLDELESVFDAAARPDVWLWALEEPVPQYRVDARLGERARLIGFDTPRQATAGETLPLLLYWEPTGPFERKYVVFAHIEVEGERIWGQSDRAPVCGSVPTTEWQAGQVVIDGHNLAVDPAAPAGEYPLLVGLYDPATGERLPVSGRDSNPHGNAARLGSVRIAPQAAQASQEN